MKKNTSVFTKFFVFALSILGGVRSSVPSISCFINLKGPCTTGSFNINEFNTSAYIDRYNMFVNDCNFDPTISSTDMLPPFLDSVLDMPCEGRVESVSLNYSFTKQCGLIEAYSALYSCINANQAKYNFFVAEKVTFTTIIYNLPLSCPFLGLGTFASANSKFNSVWIQQSRLLNVNLTNTLVHEIGHTRNLQHSGAFGSSWEYADCSCPMGCAGDINLCFNAPNANRLGWAKPIILDQSLMDLWMRVFIPIYTTAFQNHVLIQVTSDCSLYFSVRSALGPDSGIRGLSVVNIQKELKLIENTVNVHALNASSMRSMAVDFIPESDYDIWDFSTISAPVCGVKKSNIAVVHTQFMPDEKGSYVWFCFYTTSHDDCF